MDLEELKIITLCPWRITQETQDTYDSELGSGVTIKTTRFGECYTKQCPFWQPGKFGYYCARAGGI